MDVGLDEAGGEQTAAEIDGFAFSRQCGREGNDLALVDADIDKAVFRADESCISQNKIHGPPVDRCRLLMAMSGSERAFREAQYEQARAIDGGCCLTSAIAPDRLILLSRTVEATP
jgi:hypothetical protein